MEHPFRTGAPSISKLAMEDAGLLSGRYWGELRTFLAVAKAKSLNRAADQLGVSRMTAGREIRRLQDAIGAQLVVFGKTGASLTRRGEDLARALLRLDQEIHTLTNDLRAELRGAEGVVRLSVTDGIGVLFILPGIRRLSQTHPRIRVEMKSPQNYLSLIENQTDIMVGFGPENHQDLTSVRMGTYHMLPMASRTYVDRMGLPTIDNLEHHEFIDSDRYSPKGEIWKPWRKLVERGYVCIPLDLDCEIALPLYLTALTQRMQARPVRVVFELVLSLLSENNPWFAKDTILDPDPDSPFNDGYRRLFNL
jgi:DNA-binding transcriptional LysR family regulator